MFAIHKYPLKHKTVQDVVMPSGARLLDVQVQGGVLMLWAVVCLTPSHPQRPRRILIAPTGGKFESLLEPHVATVQAGDFVWHVFDLGQQEVLGHG